MKIGFTCSAFDLFHAGHVNMLEKCKSNCDYLIVGLHVNPSLERVTKNAPVQSVFERYLMLKGCKYIDEIVPYETEKDLENLFATLEINIRFLGEDYLDKEVTGGHICRMLGIKTIYINRKHSYSSSELRERVKHYEKPL